MKFISDNITCTLFDSKKKYRCVVLHKNAEHFLADKIRNLNVLNEAGIYTTLLQSQ